MKKIIIVLSFKPCYKWMTFNTASWDNTEKVGYIDVLNLVING
ncbi:hypothetical protein HMPREF1500_1095 [Fusobacterium sp. CM22]|nr:hypothetical protein HMPREF1500_1095 [Fusobacterium sp. CM22]